jgi:hypothetical protein
MTDVPLQHWAMIQSKLRTAYIEAKQAVLKEVGISKSGLDVLEREALSLMTQDKVETEWGTVQIIPDKPVTYHPLTSNSKPRTKLHFSPKKENL